MIYINKQVDYGLQFLLALCQLPTESPLSLRAFAEERNISFLFLQRIAGKLKQAGLVAATTGAKGGYFLARPIEDIYLKEIVEAIEGAYGTVRCLKNDSNNHNDNNKKCPNQSSCASRRVFAMLQKDIIASMSKYSLADMSGLIS